MTFKLSNFKSKNLLRLSGIGLFIFIIYKIDILKLFDSIKRINIYYVVLVLFLEFLVGIIKSFRWNSILKIQGIKLSHMDSFLIYYGGIFLGVATPGRLGEFVKAIHLKSVKGISLTKGILNIVVDRLFGIYLVTIFGIVGIWQFNILGKLSNISFILILFVISSPFFLLNKKLRGKGIRLLYKLVFIKKVKNKIKDRFEVFYDEINLIISHKLIYPTFLTCLIFFIFLVQCYLLVIALELKIDIVSIALFMSISKLISFIPISIAGLGTRDAILIYLFSLINLKPEHAVSYAFFAFITFFVWGGLIGAVAWWIKPLKIRSTGVVKKK